jgi:amidohydrolase
MDMADLLALKHLARERISKEAEAIGAAMGKLHDHPELAFAEEASVDLLCSLLAEKGFRVESGIAGLPTAFKATFGHGELNVAFLLEYDALPGIGHACGHNLISGAGLAASLACSSVWEQAGLTVTVLGTPAEEGGGGKVIMLERGAFDGVHAALMAHPGPREILEPTCLAVDHERIEYLGKPAHAAAFPERGVNAADALVIAQVAIGLLRQHLPYGDQVHGITLEAGKAANVVPAYATGEYFVRAPSSARLEATTSRVWRCFEAGALATGCEMSITSLGPRYAELRSDPDLIGLYERAALELGRSFPKDASILISTDMGNVSLELPSIHPIFAIGDGEVSIHEPEFAALASRPEASQAALDVGCALAWTAIEAACNPDIKDKLLKRAQVRLRDNQKGSEESS